MSSKLEQIKARLSQATPGPWKYDCGNLQVEAGEERWCVADIPTSVTLDLNGRHPNTSWNDDGELIANAPTDIAWLVAEVERLREARVTDARFYKQTEAIANERDRLAKLVEVYEIMLKRIVGNDYGDGCYFEDPVEMAAAVLEQGRELQGEGHE